MTTATPLARYGAIEGALASGLATAQLHHWWGRDLAQCFDVARALYACLFDVHRSGDINCQQELDIDLRWRSYDL
ncbi:hypothetical protein ABIA14_006628 [Sinorhizobium fredii]